MATRPPSSTDALQQRLERLSAALGQAQASPRPRPAAGPSAHPARAVGGGGLALAVALVAVGLATGTPALLVLAALLGVLSGALLVSGVGEAVLSNLPAGLAPRDATRPHIGLGATIASDAIIEPGATVEMGATVGPRAVVKRGAVVRMGATLHEGAVLEEGAVVGWGVDVMAGAVVGPGAVVGAGATIQAEASVPADMRLLPGATWTKGSGRKAEVAPAVRAHAPAVSDPREARIHAACARIEAELQLAPAQVREHLGTSEETVRALRETCLGLLAREQLLRRESAPEGLSFLDQERAELERRIAATTDATARRSLQQAVAAIEDQRRQRVLLGQSAERLDAELTRLVWTLDGMGAQLVRLRTAGQEVARSSEGEVLGAMQQLHDEIDAIADALEHVARGELEEAGAVQPVAPVAEGEGTPAAPRLRERS